MGKNCRYLQGNDRFQPEIVKLREAIANQTRVAVTLRNYRKDGRLFWNALRLIPIVNASGLTAHFVALMRDVTEARLLAEQLDRAEHLDQMTGILNRYAFVERLDGLLADQTPARTRAVKMDIARFHEINSAFGFDLGDAPLQHVAKRPEALGAGLIGRMGANEFALARFLAPHEHAGMWLRKICHPPFNRVPLRTGVSIWPAYVRGRIQRILQIAIKNVPHFCVLGSNCACRVAWWT